MEANQYLRVVVTQPEPRVMVELYGQDGKKVLELDTRNYSKPSRIVWLAEKSGEYRIRVSGAGHFEIRLEELRAAVAEDGKRVEAERLFVQGLAEARRNENNQAISFGCGYFRTTAKYTENQRVRII